MLQLKSYGGYLTYDLQFNVGGGGSPVDASSPDVVLIGSDGRRPLYHYLEPRDRPRPGRSGSRVRVRFWEGQWALGPRRTQATRPEIMTALNNVTHLLVR